MSKMIENGKIAKNTEIYENLEMFKNMKKQKISSFEISKHG